jgi:hypothetical protein
MRISPSIFLETFPQDRSRRIFLVEGKYFLYFLAFGSDIDKINREKIKIYRNVLLICHNLTYYIIHIYIYILCSYTISFGRYITKRKTFLSIRICGCFKAKSDIEKLEHALNFKKKSCHSFLSLKFVLMNFIVYEHNLFGKTF